ncbi:venom protease-like [Maniola hyperantus]|uniref:venom protease-like n=1 Tax=Aphantopus hyperantus TaxID=2795564 RepID=UPI001568AB86|nr:venom protease-like [Maniola hyperantus]
MWRLLVLIFVTSTSICDGQNYKTDLLDPEWQEVVSAGGMHIGHGRTKRFVELNENQPNIPYQACLLPNGASGHCRHLHYCIQDDFKKDFMKFMDYLCIINHAAIGVCCPDGRGEGNPDALAGDLPATAPREENDLSLKIDRAENRGCGLSTRNQGRITGAQQANPREWPWMASITPDGFEQYCGGALITDRHILTAAHCVIRWTAEELFVRLGEYDFKRSNDSRSYNFRVIEIRRHELFDKSNYHHDIAILKLHRPAVFNTYVWPICLPPRGLPMDGEVATVIGWGTQWYGGPHSKILMEVSVPIWNKASCITSFTDSVFNETICAGGKEGGKDACQGDSGGPLMYQMSSGRWAVVGVVSWGIRCGEPNHPGLYARVDQYLEWILRNSIF